VCVWFVLVFCVSGVCGVNSVCVCVVCICGVCVYVVCVCCVCVFVLCVCGAWCVCVIM